MFIYLSKAFLNVHTSPSNPSVNGNTNGYEVCLDLFFVFIYISKKYSNRDAHENNNYFYETQANLVGKIVWRQL
jgi:hypothetical protein